MKTKPIFIGENIHTKLKIQAAKEGITMRNIAELALDSYFSMMNDKRMVDTPAPYSINPRYDCGRDETD